MSKKVLILSGSPRNGGNSDILCDEFMKGAKEAGNEVEKIRVAAKKDCTLHRVLLLPQQRRKMCHKGRYGRNS